MEQAVNAPTVVNPFRLHARAPHSDSASAVDRSVDRSTDSPARACGVEIDLAASQADPSGGVKSEPHPPGVTGVAQCVELFQQLRGEAINQVDGAPIALAHKIGPTAVSAVTILERPGGLS
jgi:hypothetical protein